MKIRTYMQKNYDKLGLLEKNVKNYENIMKIRTSGGLLYYIGSYIPT